jgi:L-aspartate oxidase
MVGVLKENKADCVESHISDTIKAGAGLSEFNTVKFISEKSDAVVKDLLEFGVDFDRDENGGFAYTLEAAHSVNRVLHAGGDATGKMIEQALCDKVRANPDIEVYEKTMAVEILVDGCGECKGVIVFNEGTQDYEVIYSSAVILATGGLGQLYKYTTNPAGATADGIALAYRAGADLQDMEFVQFHPTALAIDGAENRFLISEAVRGEGARLVDAGGREFMHKYHALKELAPRDIVTRAIFNELLEVKDKGLGVRINFPFINLFQPFNPSTNNVYLNATRIDAGKLAKRFPNISQKCLEHGIDISKDFIPVAPAAHYFMGGVKTNLNGETSIKGLFAIGETASTGLHGGNRLASNSLLECVVCAYAAAKHLKSQELKAPKQIDERVKSQIDKYGAEDEEIAAQDCRSPGDISAVRKELQDLMWEHAGILRSEESLTTALEKLSCFPGFEKCAAREEYELRNMLDTAGLIIQCALERKESRGAHYRTDYPQTNDECVHSEVRKTGVRGQELGVSTTLTTSAGGVLC